MAFLTLNLTVLPAKHIYVVVGRSRTRPNLRAVFVTQSALAAGHGFSIGFNERLFDFFSRRLSSRF